MAISHSYGWFAEGFDTSDLKDARMLLDDLASDRRLPLLFRLRDSR